MALEPNMYGGVRFRQRMNVQYNPCDFNQISSEAVRSRRRPGPSQFLQTFPAQVLVVAQQLPLDVPRSFTVPLLPYIQM